MYSEKGQTLMELVVVVAISAIVVGALVFATIASLRNSQFSKNQAQATKLAQEAIERVRGGRDQNMPINGNFIREQVNNWQDPNLWTQINGNCGNTNPAPPTPPIYCYFNVTGAGVLNFLTASSKMPPNAEAIPPPPDTAIFHRAIILSDDASYQTQKTVTAVVDWTDFSGSHESKLTTILRRI